MYHINEKGAPLETMASCKTKQIILCFMDMDNEFSVLPKVAALGVMFTANYPE